MKFIIIVLTVFIQNLKADDKALCSPTFCASYVGENPCQAVPENCKIQNSTHNGVYLPSTVPCNCCEYCLAYIVEGGDCALGTTGGPIPDTICGPGLTCDPTTRKCVKKIDSECTAAQKNYDDRKQNNQVGKLETRPICDGDGYYASYKCIPYQNCFCLNKKGERIFGEIDYSESAANILTCECSRQFDEATNLIGRNLHANEFFRCLPNGAYDALQCIGDQCICVDSFDGVPTYPYDPSVNITLVSKDTMPCFDETRHQEGKFYDSCALKYIQVLEEIELLKEDGFDTIFDVTYPKCTIDGKYAPVQETSTRIYCADSDGKKIGDYELPLGDTQANGMDCKCARTKLITSTGETYECCPNGNFVKAQCRRGVCFCVDSNGVQQGIEEVSEIEVSTLSCYADKCTF